MGTSLIPARPMFAILSGAIETPMSALTSSASE